MNNGPVRVRFAPSPTGIMHLGNVRTALLNYLFAQQKEGSCILRIEDTDPERNFDPSGTQLKKDLAWLGLLFQEGPDEGGNFGPYYQSQRNHLYQEKLDLLKDAQMVYRCFCTTEELERKRERALALKLAPRYDQTCLHITPQEISKKIEEGVPFIWRFKVDRTQSVTMHDLARGKVTFHLSNFSDFPLNRADGSFTFIFANCIDDIEMNISHVIRGEDHLTNTANQLALFQAFNKPFPYFWHLPILCNTSGKKLSKRDFGFSLHDLQKAGFLPEAINNYLAIIGVSFKQEIMNMKELSQAFAFDQVHTTGSIRYDIDKLRWVNHQWINIYDIKNLTQKIIQHVASTYPAIQDVDFNRLQNVISIIRGELTTLDDAIPALHFFFEEPTIAAETIFEHIPHEMLPIISSFMTENSALLEDPVQFLNVLKTNAHEHNISLKIIFTVLRLVLTGSSKGPEMKDIIMLLGAPEARRRIIKIFHKNR